MNKQNELNYGEIITMNAFWDTCMYYIKKHKEQNLEIKMFSLVDNKFLTICKKNEMWCVYSASETKEFADCFTACTEVLRYLSLSEEEEIELLKFFANSIKKGYSYEEIEKGAKVFKKCII